MMHFYSGLLMYFCSGVDTWGRAFESRKGAILLREDFITDRTNSFKLFYGLW